MIKKIRSNYMWIWVAIESESQEILGISVSKERNMFIAERFISSSIKEYGKHSISIDGGTWYPQACRFLRLKHHTHSTFEKSLVERTMQYIKDRTKSFDGYFHCRKREL
ncbi:MAG: DDE-type integrase/transposase/recombinase [Nitrososphaeraceae archaeon]